MGKKLSKIKYISLFSLSLIYVLLTGCSQNLPEVKQTNSSIIFEYEDEESLPYARFSVFAESVSNPRRFDSLTVRSLETEYEWEVEDLVILEDENKCYAGYTNFVMPEGIQIPKGKYSAIFKNADEEEFETEFYLDYNSKIYELTSSKIPDFMKSRSGNNKIAIYDNNSVLIFYGERTNELKTTRDIWNRYQNAEVFNDIWCASGNNVICILPNEMVKPEKVESNKIEKETAIEIKD